MYLPNVNIWSLDADPAWMNGFDIYETDNNTFPTKLIGLIEYKYTPAQRGNRILLCPIFALYIRSVYLVEPE